MPKKARLRVRVSETTPSQLKKAMTLIHSKYGIKEVSVTKTDSFSAIEKVRGQRITVGNIRDADYQYGLIEEYLKTNHFVDENTLIDIKKINEETIKMTIAAPYSTAIVKKPLCDVVISSYWDIVNSESVLSNC